MLRKATSKIAHNPTVTTLRGTNQDLKLLQNLLLAEKTVLSTLEKLSADFAKASEALKAWGLIEGDDIGGILTASTLLLNHFSSALLKYASHGQSMRVQLKAIRTRIENLDDLKRQQRTISRKAEETERHLRSMEPTHRNFPSRVEAYNNFREAVREINIAIKLEEAALSDFKRTSTKMWMGLKFGGLVECCEKGMIAGKFGKMVIAEISEEITRPGVPRSLNYRRNEVESCVANAHRGVNAVTLSTVPFVGFRDRDQYMQSSSTPPSETPPAAFHISSQIGYGEPSSSGEPLLPPSFPQPQCSCEPPSLENQPSGSATSLPYAQELESSLPQAMPSYQPSAAPSVINIGRASATGSDTASVNTSRGQTAPPSNDPPAATGPVASSDTASSNNARGPHTFRSGEGIFAGTQQDPYSVRARTYVVQEEPKVEEPPEVPKPKGMFSNFFGFFK